MGRAIIYKSADLSPDGVYRYRLERRVAGSGRTALWIGVNPSTADSTIDDASIRKLYGFGELLGIKRWLVGNLFAYRATQVTELAGAQDPIGPSNDRHLASMIDEAELVIVGWGRIDKVPKRLRERADDIMGLVALRDKRPMCWGKCDCGSPRHPLMLAYSTPLEPA